MVEEVAEVAAGGGIKRSEVVRLNWEELGKGMLKARFVCRSR